MDDNRKVCSQCSELKFIEEFNFRNKKLNIRHAYCRECGKLLTRRHYKNNKSQYLERNLRSYKKRRSFIRQLKAKPCADCGIQYPYYVMDFDRREDEIKEYQLNQIDRLTIKTIVRETAKCDVVCANCHRERTFQRLNKKLSKLQIKSESD